jgi:hypothetical protein
MRKLFLLLVLVLSGCTRVTTTTKPPPPDLPPCTEEGQTADFAVYHKEDTNGSRKAQASNLYECKAGAWVLTSAYKSGEQVAPKPPPPVVPLPEPCGPYSSADLTIFNAPEADGTRLAWFSQHYECAEDTKWRLTGSVTP